MKKYISTAIILLLTTVLISYVMIQNNINNKKSFATINLEKYIQLYDYTDYDYSFPAISQNNTEEDTYLKEQEIQIVKNELLPQLISDSDFNFAPEELAEVLKNEYITYMNFITENYTDYKEYYEYSEKELNLDKDSTIKNIDKNISKSIKQWLVIESIARNENISIDESEIKERVETLIDLKNIPKEKTAIDIIGKETSRMYTLQDKVIDFLIKNYTSTDTNSSSSSSNSN